jgi:hypothetical protein
MILKSGTDETLQRRAVAELQRWSDHPLVVAHFKNEIEKQKHKAV